MIDTKGTKFHRQILIFSSLKSEKIYISTNPRLHQCEQEIALRIIRPNILCRLALANGHECDGILPDKN
jgi:hypothetical protein